MPNPNDWHLAVCDVCRLCDGDTSHKICAYCGMCDSEICVNCWNDWPRRLYAKTLRAWEKTRGLFA